MMDPIELTKRLIAFTTICPPGDEESCALYLSNLLTEGGIKVEQYPFAPGRTNIIARLPGQDSEAPLVFTGHLDTVPLGAQPWSVEPFVGTIVRDRLYGRGSSDMKSGVAAIVVAFLEIAKRSRRRRGITAILTVGEEAGCAGALWLAGLKTVLGAASALIVGEPTSNYPALGHKGALALSIRTAGVTAHSSMPERGTNAIYKAARAVTKIEEFKFDIAPHPLFGSPTISVGTIGGGMNINSVPDQAEFTIDIRSVAGQSHPEVLDHLRRHLGIDIAIETVIDMPPVASTRDSAFVACVWGVMEELLGETISPRGLPYFSDASVLVPIYRCPTIVLGPGEPEMAHQTNEYCLVDNIAIAAAAYVRIIEKWCCD
jgi:succinyl-diaminopimelate desuccinylase